MPANITDVDAFTSPVQVPDAGDPVSAASGSYLRGALQALSNRTRYAYNKIVAGVPRIRYFDDLADLVNVTGQVEGDVAVIDDTYLGLYIYVASATGAQVYPWSMKPNGFADGDAGRWRHMFYTFGVTSATLGDNKWLFNGPGRVVETMESVVTSPSSNTYADSASWQDTGLSLTKTLVIGDVISLAATTVWAVDVADDIYLRLRVDAPGGSAALDGGPHQVSPIAINKRNLAHISGKWTAAEAGSHTFKLQILVSAGGPYNATLYAQRRLSGLWVRPLLLRRRLHPHRQHGRRRRLRVDDRLRDLPGALVLPEPLYTHGRRRLRVGAPPRQPCDPVAPLPGVEVLGHGSPALMRRHSLDGSLVGVVDHPTMARRPGAPQPLHHLDDLRRGDRWRDDDRAQVVRLARRRVTGPANARRGDRHRGLVFDRDRRRGLPGGRSTRRATAP